MLTDRDELILEAAYRGLWLSLNTSDASIIFFGRAKEAIRDEVLSSLRQREKSLCRTCHGSGKASKDAWATEADARYTAEVLLAGALKNLIKEWEEDRVDGCTGARKDGKETANVNF